MSERGPEMFTPQEHHTPKMLEWEQKYGASHIVDERQFELYDPSVMDPLYFEKLIAEHHPDALASKQETQLIVRQLIQSLGRMPDPTEVEREKFRRQLFQQIENDETNPLYIREEVIPQQEVIEKRKEDFPAPEHALEAFRDGKVHIEQSDGVTRLIIEVPNQDGKMIEHPVMTDEEIEWVKKSADTIARVMQAKPGSKIFIAGLGLGLLNKELATKGISPERQVVAELNTDVISQVGGKLNNELGKGLDIRQGTSLEIFQQSQETGEKIHFMSVVNSTEQLMNKEITPTAGKLDIRQGDFKAVLQQAIATGEQFEAISIDAFPNTAEEVNRDASSKEVLELALKALRPGGLLTFYPDSRYIPKRIWEIMHQTGIPDSSMNYTVAKFKTSDFTQSYHYGELMAVIHIQKPLLDEKNDAGQVDELLNQYYATLDQKIAQYVEKHRPDTSKNIAAAA